MINIKEYDEYKKARQATEQAQTDDRAIYEQVYQLEKIQGYMAILDAGRAKERRYDEFTSKYGYEIRSNKITPEMAQSSFRGENKEFYNRYIREIGRL